MARQMVFLPHVMGLRAAFVEAWKAAERLPDLSTWEIVLRPQRAKRTLEQNAKMWAMLHDIARQIPWVVNGISQFIEPEEWKDIFTAALKQELRVAAGIDGGMVLLGRRTRKMTVKEMRDLIELMTAFGAERGVRFTCPEDQIPERYLQEAS